MKTNRFIWLFFLSLGLAVGYGSGFYRGKRASDEDWSRRTATGVAVDCYDERGNPIRDKYDDWATKFGAVTVACAPGQIAKIHGAK